MFGELEVPLHLVSGSHWAPSAVTCCVRSHPIFPSAWLAAVTPVVGPSCKATPGGTVDARLTYDNSNAGAGRIRDARFILPECL